MFDWRDYFRLAEEMAARDTDEAALRTAVSRAYYAVYHRASMYVRTNALVPARTRLTHEQVWNAFEVGNDSRRAEVADRGDLLRRSRISADYRALFPGDLREIAEDVTLEARAVLDLIDRL